MTSKIINSPFVSLIKDKFYSLRIEKRLILYSIIVSLHFANSLAMKIIWQFCLVKYLKIGLIFLFTRNRIIIQRFSCPWIRKIIKHWSSRFIQVFLLRWIRWFRQNNTLSIRPFFWFGCSNFTQNRYKFFLSLNLFSYLSLFSYNWFDHLHNIVSEWLFLFSSDLGP